MSKSVNLGVRKGQSMNFSFLLPFLTYMYPLYSSSIASKLGGNKKGK